MSTDLLAKEREFHKLNQELELKTKELMLEVDSIINKHINNSNTSILPITTLPRPCLTKSSYNETKNYVLNKINCKRNHSSPEVFSNL